VHTPLGAFLCPPGYAAPSGLRAIAREASAFSEVVRLVRRTARERSRRQRLPYVQRCPDPHGEPVVLVPGFMAGDSTLSMMARHLRAEGYRTYRSRMHANVGCTQEAACALERRIEAIAVKRDRRVSIVGHSLGGLLARAVASRRPDLVAGIVTLGSPMLAPGAVHTLLALDLAVVVRLRRAGVVAMMGEDCTSGDCARLSWEQAQAPVDPRVGFTSVFSRRDGVVDWRSCLDPAARTVEVTTSHLGMAVDPVVFDVVTEALTDARAVRRPAEGGVAVTRPATWPEGRSASAGPLRAASR
jgi:pimeloyl-ACP methyl ester carboxylesterase